MTKKSLLSFWLLFIVGMASITAQKETHDEGVVINGVKWATRNVSAPGTFADKPEDAGMFYQWNRKTGWSATDPMVSTAGETRWDQTYPEGDTWEKFNDPSPAGWRVPAFDEVKTLLDVDKVNSEWTTENGITGMRFTDKTTGNTLFLPAAGCRDIGVVIDTDIAEDADTDIAGNTSDGIALYTGDSRLYGIGSIGYYWSSMQNVRAYYLVFTTGYINWFGSPRILGFSVRPVSEF